jgi:hypothetical protein
LADGGEELIDVADVPGAGFLDLGRKVPVEEAKAFQVQTGSLESRGVFVKQLVGGTQDGGAQLAADHQAGFGGLQSRQGLLDDLALAAFVGGPLDHIGGRKSQRFINFANEFRQLLLGTAREIIRQLLQVGGGL